jgi:polyhydroxybutyrate depolymerase
MDRLCGGITSTADRYGFAVVFPQGLKHHWNDGRDANARDVDDVAFISNVTDRLIANGTADRKRIYATGISNGGFFSQYLASKLSDRFAAVASVAASLAAEATENKSEQPVAIAFFLGTKDPIVPFQGGTIGFKSLSVDRGKALSANQAISFWLANNHTAAGSITEKVLDDGKMSVSKTDYGEPGSRSEVVFYQINGGGHTWPGGLQYLPPTVIGRVCPLNANDLIFDFFSHHSL